MPGTGKAAINYTVIFHDERLAKVEQKYFGWDLSDAKQVFADLVRCQNFDGQPVFVSLNVLGFLTGVTLACHRFDSFSGDQDYWRDRLDKLDEIGFMTIDEGGRDIAGLLAKDV